MDLTIEDIKRVVESLEAHRIKPLEVTAKQAREMNKAEKALGLPGRWRAGDKYYTAGMLRRTVGNVA